MLQNGYTILDLMEVANLVLQIYDIKLNKSDIVETIERFKRIEKQNEEILKILKENK